MLSKKLFIFFLSGILFSATTSAALLNFNFTQGGYDDGWIVSGSFSGEDLNNDGILGGYYDGEKNVGFGEVTGFNYKLSQNGIAFPEYDVDGGRITYVLDGGLLGDDTIELIDVTDFPYFGDIYELVPVGAYFPLSPITNPGPDPWSDFYRPDPDDPIGLNGGGVAVISGNSSEFAIVTPAMSTVPVPSAVWLFASALFGLFKMRKISRAT
ncbi:MAG: hypothetical protein V3U87_03845 [Methylococcaceae bacterium]